MPATSLPPSPLFLASNPNALPLPFRNIITQTHPHCNITPSLTQHCIATLPHTTHSRYLPYSSPASTLPTSRLNPRLSTSRSCLYCSTCYTNSNPSGKSPHNSLNYLLHNQPSPPILFLIRYLPLPPRHPGNRCDPCAVTPPLKPPPRMVRSRVRSNWGLSVSDDDVGTRGRYGPSQHSEP